MIFGTCMCRGDQNVIKYGVVDIFHIFVSFDFPVFGFFKYFICSSYM